MPQSLAKVYSHLVFSTKNRVDLIPRESEEFLFATMGKISQEMGFHPIQVGGFLNHVHLLIMISRTETISNYVKNLKVKSTVWMKQVIHVENFKWQDGYGIFSISRSHVDGVVNYIKNQEKHHSKQNYKNECRKLFKKHDLEIDEKYFWD